MSLSGHSKKAGKENDDVLLRHYRETGDLSVLAELFEAHSSMVYYVSYRYLQDSEQSRDAVMEIFEVLINKVNRQEIREFGKWLYVLTRNHCLMQLRSEKKMQFVSIDDTMEFDGDLHPDTQDKEKKLTALEMCMEKLPPPQRRSIGLFFLDEKCYKEVSELTGYTMNEVKSHIQNGKRNLRICMDRNRER
jgi:RNA polymerase sigma-70 factor (ECF subfamily)